jgi:hypothetical protein
VEEHTVKIRRPLVGASLAGGLLAVTALPAAADHAHVRLLGNGQCVVLAEGSGEGQVQLPYADGYDEDRRHPLHVNVHLGAPGERDGGPVVFVLDSPEDAASCDGYVNR